MLVLHKVLVEELCLMVDIELHLRMLPAKKQEKPKLIPIFFETMDDDSNEKEFIFVCSCIMFNESFLTGCIVRSSF